MDQRVRTYLTREPGLPVALGLEHQPDGKALYAAWLTDFPGCISQGTSETEAVERLVALAPAFLETVVELGTELPVEPPALIPGFIQFYEPNLGGNPGIVEVRRVEGAKLEAASADDATTKTGLETIAA